MEIIDGEIRGDVGRLSLAIGANDLLDECLQVTSTVVNPIGAIAVSSFSSFRFNRRYVCTRFDHKW